VTESDQAGLLRRYGLDASMPGGSALLSSQGRSRYSDVRSAFSLLDKNGEGSVPRVEALRMLLESSTLRGLLALPCNIPHGSPERAALMEVLQRIEEAPEVINVEVWAALFGVTPSTPSIDNTAPPATPQGNPPGLALEELDQAEATLDLELRPHSAMSHEGQLASIDGRINTIDQRLHAMQGQAARDVQRCFIGRQAKSHNAHFHHQIARIRDERSILLSETAEAGRRRMLEARVRRKRRQKTKSAWLEPSRKHCPSNPWLADPGKTRMARALPPYALGMARSTRVAFL